MCIRVASLLLFFGCVCTSASFAVDNPRPSKEEVAQFLTACRECNTEQVKSLLDTRSPARLVDAKDETGQTPLHLAAAKPCDEIIDLLVAAGANTRAENKERRTALHVAAGRGAEHAVEQLLAHRAPPNASDKVGTTPLHLAAAGKSTRVVELLLEKGADPNARESDALSIKCYTPLHYAAQEGNKEIAERLIAKGADVNITLQKNKRGRSGISPMHLAAGNGKPEVVELFVAKGADVNIRDILRRTPLHWVAEVCASTEEQMRSQTPDATKGEVWQKRLEDYRLIVVMLVSHGADLNAKDDKGATPLYIARTKGCQSLADALIAHGAKE